MLKLLLIGVCALISINSQAQDLKNYPNKTVKIVVPFTAGSLVDVLGRAIGQEHVFEVTVIHAHCAVDAR